MRRTLVLLTLLLGLGLIAAPTNAQTLMLQCTGTTTCTSAPPNPVSQITGNPNPTFNIVNQDGTVTGTAFLLVAIPNGPASFTVTETTGSIPGTVAAEENKTFSSGTISTVFGEPSLPDKTFSNFVSASAQVGVNASSFQAYEYNMGSYTGGGGSGNIGVALTTLPAGTFIVAWIEDGSGTVINQTANSEGLDVGTAVPEPASMGLLGTALLGAYGLLRRKLRV